MKPNHAPSYSYLDGHVSTHPLATTPAPQPHNINDSFVEELSFHVSPTMTLHASSATTFSHQPITGSSGKLPTGPAHPGLVSSPTLFNPLFWIP